MKIVVCIRQGLDGEINPFDACAYEEALRIKNAEIILLSMGPISAKDFLLKLTRLGAKKAILLSDKAFAGADTLATAYTLSLALNIIKPDLVFCGRQTLVGDTAQTGPMLSVFANFSLITNVMCINEIGDSITCTTREEVKETVSLPSLITVERINNLRLPSIMSKMGEVEVWDAETIKADISKCGLTGSPTRVIKTFENQGGKRKCKFISLNELKEVINESLAKQKNKLDIAESDVKLKKVCIVGNKPFDFAKSVGENIVTLDFDTADNLALKIKEENPDAVLFSSDAISKRLSAQIAAILKLGLCADCTALETDGEKLIMYRPALSGSIIAKIESITRPAVATLRTESETGSVAVAIGYGAKDYLDKVKTFANSINAEIVTTRKAVDNDILPYSMQVGLTGKTVSPNLYIAVGVSGQVHHIVGCGRSGTVIAINTDKDAPIFDYADYGIIMDAKEL